MGIDLATILGLYIIGVLVTLILCYGYFFAEETNDADRMMFSVVLALLWPFAVLFHIYEFWKAF